MSLTCEGYLDIVFFFNFTMVIYYMSSVEKWTRAQEQMAMNITCFSPQHTLTVIIIFSLRLND